MSCRKVPNKYEPIADELEDKSLVLYPNHTIFTHMGCVLLRSVIGLALMHKDLVHSKGTRDIIVIVIALSILLPLIFFSYKYFKCLKNNTILWKSYPRMIIAYSIALGLIYSGNEKSAGLLIIMDALVGLQSRHTASVLSCGIKK